MQWLNRNKVKSVVCLLAIFLYIVSFYWWFGINVSHSLPEKVFVYQVGNVNLKVGDFVVAKAHNLPEIKDGIKLFKIVSGVPGQEIKVINKQVFIDNKEVAVINETRGYWGQIHPIKSQKIKPGCYFLLGVSFDSFDSRYEEFNLVCKKNIIGKAYAFF